MKKEKSKFNWTIFVKCTVFLAVIVAPFVLFNNEYTSNAIQYLFGGIEPFVYKFAFVFAFMGLFIKWYYVTKKGVKYSEKSPEKFNADYWISDNFYNKILSILFTYVALFLLLRFSNDILGFELTMFVSLVIGLTFEAMVEKLVNLTVKTKGDDSK